MISRNCLNLRTICFNKGTVKLKWFKNFNQKSVPYLSDANGIHRGQSVDGNVVRVFTARRQQRSERDEINDFLLTKFTALSIVPLKPFKLGFLGKPAIQLDT